MYFVISCFQKTLSLNSIPDKADLFTMNLRDFLPPSSGFFRNLQDFQNVRDEIGFSFLRPSFPINSARFLFSMGLFFDNVKDFFLVFFNSVSDYSFMATNPIKLSTTKSTHPISIRQLNKFGFNRAVVHSAI